MALNNQTSTPEFVKPNRAISGINGTGSADLFDLVELDNAIFQRGVKLVHMSGMPCPVGRNSREDSTRRSHEDHIGCQGGFIYTVVGTATCLFSSNSRRANFTDAGMADGDTVALTMPRFYDDTQKEVKVVPYDRLYLDECITVVHWQLNEYSGLGTDSAKFPIISVDSLVDWRGESYQENVDFTIDHGRIIWGNRSPGINPETGLGAVYSIRYTYRPWYKVESMGHEIRLATQILPGGIKTVTALPQQISVVRENVARNADNDPFSPAADSRKQLGPNDVNNLAAPFFVPTT